MRTTGRFSILLLSASWILAPSAPGELQNVEVNGCYFLPDDDRMAEAAFVPCDQGTPDGPHMRLCPSATPYYGGRSAGVRFNDVAIPPMPQPERYARHARVFLCFYVRVPQWTPQKTGAIDLNVTIDDYRVFQCDFSEPGWRPWLVDVGPWAGKHVSIVIRAGVPEGQLPETVIALPRTVACHGPFYAGNGGVSTGPGPHGMPLAAGGRSGRGMEEAVQGNGPLALLRLDAIKPSTVRLTSGGQGYNANITRGIYWLPLPLNLEEPDIQLETLSGLAERGPIDLVPNFLANDQPLLAQITQALTP